MFTMPSASAMVYLFGDLFAEQDGLSGSEQERKFHTKEEGLAAAMFVVEFVTLMELHHIRLQSARTKRMGWLVTDRVHATLLQAPPHAAGLEQRILVYLGNGYDRDIKEIVWRVLEHDSPNPWSATRVIVEQELVEAGYLSSETRVDRVALLEREAKELKARLAAVQQRGPELYSILWKHVEEGLRSRKESAD